MLTLLTQCDMVYNTASDAVCIALTPLCPALCLPSYSVYHNWYMSFRRFPVTGLDDKGNSLLIVACQQSNLPMIELLMRRGAAGSINHRNATGNTALHYALAFDAEVRGALLVLPLQMMPLVQHLYNTIRHSSCIRLKFQ